MSDHKKTRRRRKFVEPTVQSAVAVRLILLWVATLACTAFVSVMMAYFRQPEGSFFAHLADPRHWAPSAIAFAAVLPLAVLNLIRFTHRFAGPVHRLRNELRRLAAGEQVPPLKFRQRDYWQSLADDFNNVAKLVSRDQTPRACTTSAEGVEAEAPQ